MCLAIPGQILEITGTDELTRMARISFAGVIKEASLAYTPEAQPGDYVLVHAGFALNTIDEAEAQKTLELLRQLDDQPG
ncbi:MAG: HypC/HybG/HupF family hydrogenase formation chaperone [Acidobacteria bacterium]|nr:HypC/HybG/HupF family hydrogenase formation chaperone [Acidobacteriota bacterium]